MRIKSVTFGYTRNIGDFQSTRADCTIEVDGARDSYEKMMCLAEAVVFEKLEMPLSEQHKRLLSLEKAKRNV